MAQQEHGAQIQALLDAKRMQGEWPLTRINYFISQLTEYDLVIEKKAKVYTGLTAGSFIGAFIFIFVAAFLENWKVALIIPVLIVVGIITLIITMKYSKLDLRNEFREFLAPLLDNLKEDIKPESDISLDLHLTSVEDKAFFQGKSDKYSKGVYHKCYDHIYERDLLTMSLPLIDGNRLALSGHEYLIKSVKTKRNPRGKYKTKTKYKKKVMFDIRLRINPDKFQIKKLPDEGKGPLKRTVSVKGGQAGKTLRLQFTSKVGGGLEDPVPDWKITLEQIVYLYSFLSPLQADASS
ncbi:hypothetical protein ACFL27_06395 [candidate division CSSED10-310 bacterium]|uniref:Uncharacterized protein n=1 Tax=candidate division CSSED10-310 bacterium TaxID=2855610 RepID=A0ABV6YUE2_UNCC1